MDKHDNHLTQNADDNHTDSDNHTVRLNPVGWMSQLSQNEMALITDRADTKHYELFRNCVLAVLNSGAERMTCMHCYRATHSFLLIWSDVNAVSKWH
jgi:hypothetical protein